MLFRSMADWLKQCGICTVAMQSTGVYWIAVFDILEAAGLEVYLVNARDTKNLPGRKSDVQESQWLMKLHTYGLLRNSFRPSQEIRTIRTYWRQRNDLIRAAGSHIQRMQKALTQMNVQIHHVINDLTGLTGMAIVDAIVQGERDASKLAQLRDPRIKASPETIRKSLVGNWRAEHLFTLRQSRDLYRTYQRQIEACDQEIEKLLHQTPPRVDPDTKPLPPDKNPKSHTKILPDSTFNMRTEAYKLFGVDLTQVPGLARNILALYSEIGRDTSRWATAGHFTSWLTLCPDNDVSGGRVLWRGMRHHKNRAAKIFRLAAYGLHRSQSLLGDYLRRMKAKLGPAAAITATARKIAVIFYTMVKNQVEYDETKWLRLDTQRQARIENKLRRQAQRMGFRLVSIEESAL